MSQQTGNKWGTTNPLIKRDPDFGIVRLRAHGSYVFRVTDPAKFLRELVSTDPTFEDYEIDTQLRQVIVSEFAKVIGSSPVPLLDLLSNYEQLADYVRGGIVDDFEDWGLEVNKFYISNISVPAEVEAAMDRRTSMGVVGDLSKYTQFQTAEAMREAASAPGGMAGAGVGLGAGMMMGQQMAGSLMQQSAQPQAPTAPTPPPVPQPVQFHIAVSGQSAGPFDMATLQTKVGQGLLTQETLVWKQGMGAWAKASEVTELQPLFGGMPPPLPQ